MVEEQKSVCGGVGGWGVGGGGFFFNDTATTEIYTLSLHDALPISFAAVHVYADHLQVQGFGREDSRELALG